MAIKNTSDTPAESTPTTPQPDKQPKLECGIIMPISEMGTYSEAHWLDVRRIIIAAAKEAEFTAEMVSTGADVGIIHANIINNIYQNQMVVCDVSGKNPNVMFELGLRLASKLPVIIIKDDSTTYSFDTSPIEHLEYRRDLRIFDTLDFQKRLTKKIKDTYTASQQKGYKTFLDHFGNYTLANVEDKAVDLSQFMGAIFSRLDAIEQNQNSTNRRSFVSQSVKNPASTRVIRNELKELIQPFVNSYLAGSIINNSDHFESVCRDVTNQVKKVFAQEVDELPMTIVIQAVRGAVENFLDNRSPRTNSPLDN